MLVFISCLILLLYLTDSHAANFSINPIRVFFNGTADTAILKIQNESDKGFTIQMSTYLWTQDDDGKDIYTETKDIIYFPKIAEVKGSEEKTIRLGIKKPRSNIEQAYRIYIDEIRDPEAVEGSAITFLMKVGVPIFISPLHSEIKGDIENPELAGGSLKMAVKNKGNVQFIISAIKIAGNDASGKEVYSTERGGGYLHAGISKKFDFEIPAEKCSQVKTISITVDTDRDLNIGRTLDVTKEMCGA